MLSLPSFLAFVLPAPAIRDAAATAMLQRRRRRAVTALRLAPHLLKDVGLEEFYSAAEDPRWVRRFDLER